MGQKKANLSTQENTMETKVKVMNVTPEMAQKWLAENRYEHQRIVRTLQVKFLAEEMERGTFKQDTVIEFTGINGSEWLTDGQHRLTALTWAKLPQRFVVVHRRLTSEEELALDYTRTDQVIVRTIAESYKTLNLEQELALTPTQVTALGVAVTMIEQRFEKYIGKMHPDDRLRMMREYSDAFDQYIESVSGARKELRHRLERKATLAVGLVTFRYSANVFTAEKVDQFWNGMAMDDGLKQNDPRKVANRHIIEYGMAGGNFTAPSKTVSPLYSARYLATCFNAWVSNKEMKFAKPDVAQPILILGSPFNGKQA